MDRDKTTNLGSTPADLFGIECGEGWAKLYNPLIIICQFTGSGIAQIKEKFGGLRFYIHSGPEWLYDLIETAENQSYHVCEQCGSTNDVSTEGPGWIQTLCGDCKNGGD